MLNLRYFVFKVAILPLQSAEFTVHHLSRFRVMDESAAARQAHRLEKVLAEEHERDRKHPARIQLPE